MKRTKHATNFSLKILNDIVKVRGFSPNILTLARKELSEYSTSAYLVSVNSQHNNYDSVTIWVCHSKIIVRVVHYMRKPYYTQIITLLCKYYCSEKVEIITKITVYWSYTASVSLSHTHKSNKTQHVNIILRTYMYKCVWNK